MKKIVIILMLFLSIITNVFSQDIIVFKGDTVVTLKKEKIDVINEIALQRKYLIQELQFSDSINLLKDSIIIEREEEIKRFKYINEINSYQMSAYDNKISELEKSIIKKNRQKNIAIGSGIALFLLGIIFL